MKVKKSIALVVIFLVSLFAIVQGKAEEAKSITEAISSGKASWEFRVRYETVDQDNSLADADALTLRTKLAYKTGTYSGFGATVEFEDSREIFSVDDFSVPPAGVRPGQFSVIADPETTELNQAYLSYEKDGLAVKLGRQVIALDGQRFIGPVGWRQDWQTFDAATVSYKKNDFTALASYISKRNRIFGEEADIDSEDVLLNTSFKTPIGKIVGYVYLLEVDNNTNNSLDTYGVSLQGSRKIGENKLAYVIEFAKQDSNDTFDADYLFAEAAYTVAGVTGKLGYEVLGSDNGEFGFATPLATLHKFNGWADLFLTTPTVGLTDLYFTLTGKAAGGKWLAVYHDFSADEGAATDDLGSEINLQYSRSIGKNYNAGIKYAAYEAGDVEFQKVDTDKLWVWFGAKF